MNAQPSTSTPYASPMILTSADVERLLNDESHESRIAILDKVSSHYNGAKFQGREREIAEQIFRLLVKDVTVRVRAVLAERLKDNPNAPRDVVLKLANDVESVALPILQASYVLSDADLISIIEASHDIGKLMAISNRETVSSRVSDALVETNYPQVVTSLLVNQGATISERAYEKISTAFKNEPSITDAMVARYPLPRSVVERLVAQVSETVARELKEKYSLNDADQKQTDSGARDDVMQQLLEGTLDKPAIIAMVDRLMKEDKLTPSLAMTALCRGQLIFFTVALAKFSGVPIANAEQLIADRGDLGFRGIYNKSGLPDTMYDAIRLLLNAVRDLDGGEALPGSMHYANRLVSRVVTLAGDQPIEYLPYFIALIRQNVR
ncbi:MAG: DUF2336 domain-containing protein [Rickettsiales bacterium]